MLANGVNSTGSSVVFNVFLGPDIGPDWRVDGGAENNQCQSDNTELHRELLSVGEVIKV